MVSAMRAPTESGRATEEGPVSWRLGEPSERAYPGYRFKVLAADDQTDQEVTDEPQ